jgi:hypothetical protein
MGVSASVDANAAKAALLKLSKSLSDRANHAVARRAPFCSHLSNSAQHAAMQRDTRLLLFDIAAFYALGLPLMVATYVFDERVRFVFVMIFWIKATTGIVLVGMLYWLCCIVATSLGHRPKAPVRNLGRLLLSTGVVLFVLHLFSSPPEWLRM